MGGEADRSVVMRSPCAGDALDPPLWIVPNKKRARALSLSRPGMRPDEDCDSFRVYVFITAVPIKKLVAWGEGDSARHVLRETTSRGLCGLVCPSHTS